MKIVTACVLAAGVSAAAQTGPASLAVTGQLADASGNFLTNSGVTFHLEVWDQSNACRLYAEDQAGVDLSMSNGRFTLVLGAGSNIHNYLANSTALDASVFTNSGVTPGFSGCPGGVSLGAGDGRNLHVSYNLGSGLVALTPAAPITSTAFAMVADSLQGKHAADFVQIVSDGSTALTQVNASYAFSAVNWPRLKALVDGTSSQYLPTSPTSPVSVNSQRVINVTDPTSAQDAATKNYVDTMLGGKPVDVSATGPMTGTGDVLQWDGTQNKWVAAAPSTTPTGSAGGDLTGTYPNPSIANNAVTAAKINTTGGGVSRLLITDATTGTTVGFGVCALNQVYAWTASGWACTNVSALAPVTSVATKTGAVTLNPGDIVGLGSAALYDVGTAASRIPQLDASGRMPAVDGSPLTNVNAVQIQARPVVATAPTLNQVLAWNGGAWVPTSESTGTLTDVESGIGLLGGPITTVGTLSVDVGTAPNKIVQLNASAQIPGVDASLLYNVNASKIATRAVSSASPAAGQVLGWNNTTSAWEPMLAAQGSVINIASGNGLQGGPITTTGTLSIDSGTGPNKVLQLSSIAQIPAVDGSLLTGINAVKLQTRTLAATPPVAGQVIGWNAVTTQWEPTAGNSYGVSSIATATGLVGGTITSVGTLAVDVGTAPNKVVQLNASAQMPAVDGSLLTGVNAVKLQTRMVSAAPPVAAQVLGWNAVTTQWEPTAVGAASSVPISSLTAAVAGNSIDNTNFSQVWNWSSLTTQTPLTMTANGLTSGSGLVVSTSSNAFASTGGLLQVANTGTSTSGVIARVQANSALGSGLTVLASGNVGINSATPAVPLDVGGFVRAQTGVQGGNAFSPNTVFQGVGGTGTGVSFPAANTMAFATGSNERLRVDQNGNLGIGTNAPTSGVDVALTGTVSSAIVVPRDSVANRPSTPVNGMIRYASDAAKFEVYQNGAWQNMLGGMASSLPLSGITAATASNAIDSLNFPQAWNWSTATSQASLSLGANGLTTGSILSLGSSNAGFNSTAGMLSVVNAGTSTSGVVARLQSNGTAGSGLIVRANGYVGIGTDQPIAKLFVPYVTGDTVTTAQFGDWTNASNNQTAVGAYSYSGIGLSGNSNSNIGAFGISNSAAGVRGQSTSSYGVLGYSGSGQGVMGTSNSGNSGYFFSNQNTNTSATVLIQQNGTSPADLTQWKDYLNNTRMVVSSNGYLGVGTPTPQAALDVATTGSVASAIIVPRDTSGNRPSPAVNGMIRYASDLGKFEVYQNGAWQNMLGGMASSLPLSGITAATASNAIDSLNFPQTWNWSTATTQTNLAMNSNVLTSGTMLSLSSSSPNLNSGSGLLNVSNSGTSTSGLVARVQSNATLGSGLTVLANGNVGIGTASPLGALHVAASTNSALVVTAADGTSQAFRISGNNTVSTGTPSLRSDGANVVLNPSSAGSLILNADSGARPTQINPGGGYTTIGGNVGIGTSAPVAGLDVATTGTAASAIVVPRDSVANRPSISVNGMIRYASDTSKFEVYQNGAWQNMLGGMASSLPLSGITAASAGNSIDNLSFAQTWNWSSVTTGTPMTMTANALSSGSLLSLTTSSANLNSGNALLNVANTGTSTSGMIVRLQANGAAGSGVTLLSNGNLGIGTTAPDENLMISSTNSMLHLRQTPAVNDVWIGAAQINAQYIPFQGPNEGVLRSYSKLNIGVTSNASLSLGTSGLERMTIAAGGNVGIGSTMPSAGLDIATLGTTGSAIIVPRDTVANRPVTPVNGMIRYASDSARFEAYQNGSWQTMIGGAASSLPLSGILAATASNTIDSLNFPQAWNWSTATTHTDLSHASNGLTTGSILSLSSSSSALASSNGLLSVANTGTSTSGLVARIQSNGTAGSGLTVLASGNVGIGTSAPTALLDVQNGSITTGTPGVNIAQTWNNGSMAFGALTVNANDAASAASSVLADFRVNGTSAFSIGQSVNGTRSNLVFGTSSAAIGQYNGGLLFGSTSRALAYLNGSYGTDDSIFKVSAGGAFGFSNIAGAANSGDVYLSRRGPANLRLGLADMAAPIAQTLSVQGVAGGTSNTAGPDFTVTGAQGTGTGVGGAIKFQTAPAGFSGTAPNTLVTALTIAGGGSVGVGTTIPAAGLDVALTGTVASAIIVPRDTVANRPSVPVNGMIRYASDTAKLEAYQNGAWQPLSGGAASSLPLSGITAATASNSIDSLNFPQAWNWSTATTQTPLSVNANALTTGSMLSLATTNSSLNSTGGLLNVANTGTSTSGVVARIQANAGAQSGVTVLANGNVGIGATNPTSSLQTGTANLNGILNVGTYGASVGYNGSNVFFVYGNAGAGAYTMAVQGGGASNASHVMRYLNASSTTIGYFDASGNSYTAGNAGIGTTGPQAALDVATTGTAASAIIVPRDTTGNRPLVPVNGMIRYASDLAKLEAYQNGSWQVLSGGSASSLPLSGITAATATNTIDNLNLSQAWNWSTATTQTAQVKSANALTTGGLLALTSASNGLNSTVGLLNVANSGTSTSGLVARVQSNSTAGSGLSVLANGNVGVGSTAPTTSLDVKNPAASIDAARFYVTGQADGGISVGGSGSAVGYQGLYANAGDLYLRTNNTQRLRIVSSGYTIIGNGIPLSPLDVTGGVAIGSYGGSISAPTNGMIVSGVVGLGTSAPLAGLDVNFTGTGASAVIVPRDTVANRPSVPVNGMIRYATDTAKLEAYQNGSWQNVIGAGGGALSALTAATATNTIDNSNYAQTWNWSTATTHSALSLAGNALTTGSMLNLTSSNVGLNSANGLLNVANTGTSTSGLIARVQANSTAGSGLAVYANGYVGVGSTSVVSPLSVSGNTAGYSISNGVMNVSNASTTSNNSFSAISPNLTTGQETFFNFGVNSGFYNWASFGFYYAGSNSLSNRVDIQTAASSPIMSLVAGGNVGINSTSPAAGLDVALTGTTSSAIIVPRDSIANRPTVPVNGMIRYAIDTAKFEAYQNGSWQNVIGAGGGGAISALTAATATNTIDSLNFAQTWNWSTATTHSGVTISSSNASLNSTNGLLSVINAGTSTSGMIARVQSNSTAGSGLTVLANGNVGVGSAAPAAPFQVSTSNGTQMQVLDGGASTVDYVTVSGRPTNGGVATAGGPVIATQGSDALIPLVIAPKGGGNAWFSGGGGINIVQTMASGNSGFFMFYNSNHGEMGVYNNGWQYLDLQTGGGNVGIGAASAPGSKLDVNGNLSVGYFGTAAPMSGAIIGGNVGIGTSTPLAGLDVAGTGTISSAIIVPRDTTGNRPAIPVNGMIRYAIDTAKFEAYQNGSWQNVIGAGGGGALSALTAATATNTIDSLNFAQTWNWSTAAAQSPLSLSANALSTGSLLSLTSSSGSLNSTNGILNVANTGTATSGLVARLQSNGTAGSGLTVLANGNVGVGSASPAYTLDVNGPLRAVGITDASDVRLKRDVRSLDDSLDKILHLRGVSYWWRDPSKSPGPQIGLIAQEVEPIFPELVSTDSAGMKSVGYAHLIAPVIEAIKSLYARWTSTDARVKSLAEDNARLQDDAIAKSRALDAVTRELAEVKRRADTERAARERSEAELRARLERLERLVERR